MIDLSEVNRLSADLRAAPLKAAGKARVAMTKATLDIERDAKTLAPVDTGNLRSSISHEISGGGDVIESVIGPTAYYGIFVELGTARMAPQPFMSPAFDRNASAIEQVFGQIADGLL